MNERAERRSTKQVQRFDQRLDLLRDVTSEFADLLEPTLVERCSDVARRADGRIGLGTRHTVVAIAGATGSGKSSLFNALAGHDLAVTGVRRPTTSIAEAVTFAPGADELLDWLGIKRHHLRDEADLDGLVLVDLPDHDSIVDTNRDEMERLAETADLFCWVVDPQKYADAALHHDYLTRFARHGAVTVVALNQVDRLDAVERAACSDHLRQLLAADGLAGVRVIETSTISGEGVAELRRELMARVTERRAAVARLDADVDWVAGDLAVAVGDAPAEAVRRAVSDELGSAFAGAAGVDGVAAAVAAAHRIRSNAAIGWPPTRWIGALRADPLRRLGLGSRQRQTNRGDPAVSPATATAPTTATATATATASAPAPATSRTSRSGPTPVARAVLTTAVRDTIASVADPLPPRWRQHLDGAVDRDEIADQLDVAVARTDLHVDPPRWWRVASALQWLFAAVMVAGAIWLTVAGAVLWTGLPELPTPQWRQIGVPTWMLFGGAVAGIAASIVGGRVASVASTRRARRARSDLVASARKVSDRLVVQPLDAELERMANLQQRVRQISHRRT